jgi:hypothetical protein
MACRVKGAGLLTTWFRDNGSHALVYALVGVAVLGGGTRCADRRMDPGCAAAAGRL